MPCYLIKCTVTHFLGTGLYTEVDTVALVYRHSLCRSIMRSGITFGNRLTPQFGITLLDGYPYTVGLAIRICIIITGRSNQRNRTGYAYNTVPWCDPYTDGIFHRRQSDNLCLFFRINRPDGNINLGGVVNNRTRRIGTAESECRNSIALCVKFYMIEIYFAI